MAKYSLQHQLSRSYRMLTSILRRYPDFLVIGGVKGGTTSIYKYLIEHPSIASPTVKEVRYFDNNPYKNHTPYWYRSHFPLSRKLTGSNQLTGEASPSYFHNFEGPKRVFQMVPNAKLILCLRNPIDRAYSHYSMNKKNKKRKQGLDLPGTFEQIAYREMEIIQKHRPPLLATTSLIQNLQPLSGCTYISSGIYVYSLHRWLQIFPKDQLLIIKSEDLFSDPKTIMNRVYQFLGLSSYTGSYTSFNVGSYAQISEEIKQKLIAFYQPYNQLLYDYLERDFDWS